MGAGATAVAVHQNEGTRLGFLDASECAPWPELNPRTHFDPDALAELTASIRAQGIRQPLAVHDRGPDVPAGEVRYWIVAGERRWRSGSNAGVPIPVAIGTYTYAEALEVALIENLQRASLNPIEEARGFQKRLDVGDVTEAEMAERLGVSQPHVNNRRRLLELPEPVQDLIARGLVKPTYARDMLLPWVREEPAVADRFFRVLVQHLEFQADVNEPFTKAFLAGVVAQIGAVVKPVPTTQPKPKAAPKAEAAPKPAVPERPEPAAVDPEPEPTPMRADAPAPSLAPAPAPEPAVPAATDPAPAPADTPEPSDSPEPTPEPTPEPSVPTKPEPLAASAAEAATDGMLAALHPLLGEHDITLTVRLPRKDGPITVALAPVRKDRRGAITPRVVKRPVEEIDLAVAEAARAFVAELTEDAAA